MHVDAHSDHFDLSDYQLHFFHLKKKKKKKFAYHLLLLFLFSAFVHASTSIQLSPEAEVSRYHERSELCGISIPSRARKHRQFCKTACTQ